MPEHVDVTGMLFGRLTAIRMTVRATWKPQRQREKWLCRCDCDGKEVEVSKENLMSGNTKSCGCLFLETLTNRSTTHGHGRRGRKSAEYRAWANMHTRCGNPNFKDFAHYGGRGISVCERWNDFETFLADMGPRPSPQHSLDRIDQNGNYEPGNCRWATLVEQANNKRDNHLLTVDGRKQTIAQWCREANIPRGTLLKAVDARWHPELLRRLLQLYRERAEQGAAA